MTFSKANEFDLQIYGLSKYKLGCV